MTTLTGLTRDPLLAIARGAIVLSIALTIIVGASTAIAAPILMLARYSILAHTTGMEGVTANTFLLIGALLLIVTAMAVCAFLFLRHLRRIIDSVGVGDPFNPINATRLTAMGWLTVAIEGISVPAGAMAEWIEHGIKGAHSDVGFGVSLGGLLLAIILFILARVFRQGAAMRAELEGTV